MFSRRARRPPGPDGRRRGSAAASWGWLATPSGVVGYPIRVGWTAGQVAGCSAAVVELPVGSSSCYDGNELRGQAAMGPSPIGRCGSWRRVGRQGVAGSTSCVCACVPS